MPKTYKSKILAAVREAMQDAHDVGVIDKKMMREFDASCLTEVAMLSPKDVVALREREGVNQAVMARHSMWRSNLSTSGSAARSGFPEASLKLLVLVKAKGLQAIL